MKTSKRLTILLLLFTLAPFAYAADAWKWDPDAPDILPVNPMDTWQWDPAGTGIKPKFYLGGGIGMEMPNGPPKISPEIHFIGGATLTKRFALELGAAFYPRRERSGPDIPTPGKPGEFSISRGKTSVISISALGKYPILGDLEAFLRAGLQRLSYKGGKAAPEEHNDISLLIGIGLEHILDKNGNIAVRIEYIHAFSSRHDINSINISAIQYF